MSRERESDPFWKSPERDMPTGNITRRAAGSGSSVESTPLVAGHASKPGVGILCIRDRVTATRLIMLLLCIAMVGKECSNGSLSAAMHELSEYGLTDVVANMPGVGTIFYGLGKFSQVFANYYVGARLVLFVTSCLSAIGQILFLTASPSWMMLGWAMSQFANAHLWATAIRVIAQWVHGSDVGRSVAAIGAATDFGIIFANGWFASFQAIFESNVYLHAFSPFLFAGGFLSFESIAMGTFLRDSAQAAGFDPPTPPPASFGKEASSSSSSSSGGSGGGGGGSGGSGGGRRQQENAAPASAAAQLASSEAIKRDVSNSSSSSGSGGGGGGGGGGGESPQQRAPPSLASHPLDALNICDALWSLAHDVRVWLALSTNMLYALYMGVMGFVPKMAIEKLGYPDEIGTLLQIAAPIGSVVASVAGGYAIDTCSKSMVKLIGYVLVAEGSFASVALITLLSSGGYQALGVALPWLLMLMNLTTGFYWNVVLNVFCVRFGGANHASTLVFALEVSIYVLSVPLSFMYGHLAAARAWSTMFSCSVALFLLGNAVAVAFVLVDDRMAALPRAVPYFSRPGGGGRGGGQGGGIATSGKATPNDKV